MSSAPDAQQYALKCVVFDFHGVLADFGPVSAWAAEHARSSEFAAALELLETGRASLADFLQRLPDGLVPPVSAAALRARPEMITALGALRASGLRIAVVTNTFRGFSALRARAGFPDDLFDLVVESWRERVRKPEAAILMRTLERLEAQPGECLFIDDQMPNVLAAARLGFRVIRATTTRETLMLIDSHCRAACDSESTSRTGADHAARPMSASRGFIGPSSLEPASS